MDLLQGRPVMDIQMEDYYAPPKLFGEQKNNGYLIF